MRVSAVALTVVVVVASFASSDAQAQRFRGRGGSGGGGGIGSRLSSMAGGGGGAGGGGTMMKMAAAGGQVMLQNHVAAQNGNPVATKDQFKQIGMAMAQTAISDKLGQPLPTDRRGNVVFAGVGNAVPNAGNVVFPSPGNVFGGATQGIAKGELPPGTQIPPVVNNQQPVQPQFDPNMIANAVLNVLATRQQAQQNFPTRVVTQSAPVFVQSQPVVQTMPTLTMPAVTTQPAQSRPVVQQVSYNSVPEPTLPSAASGQELTLLVNGAVAENPGRVALQFGSHVLPVTVLDWQAGMVTVQLPSLLLPQTQEARIYLADGNDTVLDAQDFLLQPAK